MMIVGDRSFSTRSSSVRVDSWNFGAQKSAPVAFTSIVIVRQWISRVFFGILQIVVRFCNVESLRFIFTMNIFEYPLNLLFE